MIAIIQIRLRPSLLGQTGYGATIFRLRQAAFQGCFAGFVRLFVRPDIGENSHGDFRESFQSAQHVHRIGQRLTYSQSLSSTEKLPTTLIASTFSYSLPSLQLTFYPNVLPQPLTHFSLNFILCLTLLQSQKDRYQEQHYSTFSRGNIANAPGKSSTVVFFSA